MNQTRVPKDALPTPRVCFLFFSYVYSCLYPTTPKRLLFLEREMQKTCNLPSLNIFAKAILTSPVAIYFYKFLY